MKQTGYEPFSFLLEHEHLKSIRKSLEMWLPYLQDRYRMDEGWFPNQSVKGLYGKAFCHIFSCCETR